MAETREKTVLEIGYEEASLERLKAQLKELAQLARPLGNLTGGEGGSGGGSGSSSGGGSGGSSGGGGGGGGSGGGGGGSAGGGGGQGAGGIGRAASQAIGVASSGSAGALFAGGGMGLGSMLGATGTALGGVHPALSATLKVAEPIVGAAGAALAGGYISRQMAFREHSATQASMAPLAALGGGEVASQILSFWGGGRDDGTGILGRTGYSPQEASGFLQSYLKTSGRNASLKEAERVLELQRFAGIGAATSGTLMQGLTAGGGLVGSSGGLSGLVNLYGGVGGRLGINPSRMEEFIGRLANNTRQLAEKGINLRAAGLGTDLLTLRNIDEKAFGGFRAVAAQERMQQSVVGAGQGFGLGLFPKQASNGLMLAYAMQQTGGNVMQAAEWLEQASERPGGILQVLRGAADQAGLSGVAREGFFSGAAGNVRQGRRLAGGWVPATEEEDVKKARSAGLVEYREDVDPLIKGLRAERAQEGNRYARADQAIIEDSAAYTKMLDIQNDIEGLLFKFGEGANQLVDAIKELAGDIKSAGNALQPEAPSQRPPLPNGISNSPEGIPL